MSGFERKIALIILLLLIGAVGLYLSHVGNGASAAIAIPVLALGALLLVREIYTRVALKMYLNMNGDRRRLRKMLIIGLSTGAVICGAIYFA